jgi:hypothetical protein
MKPSRVDLADNLLGENPSDHRSSPHLMVGDVPLQLRNRVPELASQRRPDAWRVAGTPTLRHRGSL